MDPITIIKDDADKIPPLPPGRHPLTPISGADFEARNKRRFPVVSVIITTLFIAGVVGWFIYRLNAALDNFSAAHPLAGPLFIGVLFTTIIGIILTSAIAIAMRLLSWGAQGGIIRSRLGVPLSVVGVLRTDPLTFEGQAVMLEMERARYSQHPNLSTLTGGASSTPALVAPDEDAAEPVLDAVPVSEWLRWMDEVPHVIFAAKTKGGKSTTAKAVLAPRIAANEDVFVIDPHSSAWPVPGVGGGEDWETVQRAMHVVEQEYKDRLQERKEHLERTGKELPVEHFPRLTVLLDEANLTQMNLDKAPRGKESPWERFVKALGSGARKVNISILLLCQSANVDDLNITGSMRENFLSIALDARTTQQLIKQDEKNVKRREQLYSALEGRAFPAVASRNFQVYLLDRTGLDSIPIPDGNGCVWERGYTFCSESASADGSQQPSTTPFITEQNSTERRDRIIKLLFTKRQTVRSVAAAVRNLGYEIDNDRLVALRREVLGAD